MLIDVAGVHLELLADRAVWLAATRTLLIADLHLGKAQSFRRLGVPVPSGTTARSLARLDQLIEQHRPTELIVLGDLLHGPLAQQGPAIEALAVWREGHAGIAVRMVRGNHDASAGDPPARCGVEVIAGQLERGGLALCHDSADAAGRPALAGHLHPVLRMRGRADRLRVACYWLRPDALVLPAFGEFTGGWPVRPGAPDRVFAIADQRVIEIDRRVWSTPGLPARRA